MIVVADTSPVRYLVLLGYMDVLPRMYGSVVIPEAVLDELKAERSPNAVRQFLSDKPQWLVERSLSKPVPSDLLEVLDRGESEAIELAVEIGADLLLIDERRGRGVGKSWTQLHRHPRCTSKGSGQGLDRSCGSDPRS